MLVLAMEFSRGAQHTQGVGRHQTQDRCHDAFRVGERPGGLETRGRRRWEVELVPGCSDEQGSGGHSLKTE